MKASDKTLAGLVLSAIVGLWGGHAEPWTLEQAIGCALTNSPDARIAQRRIVAARAGIDQANSALWPQLQLQSSYLRTDNPMLAFGSILNQRSYSPALDFNDVPDVDDLNVRGVMTMPIYAGGRIQAGRHAAQANTESVKATSEAIQNSLAFEVARSFHTVGKTRDLIRAAESAVDSFEKHLVIASNRLDTGLALKIDLLDVQVRLAQAREELSRIRNANALSRRTLRIVLGFAMGDIDAAEPIPTVTIPEGSDFARRPELRALLEAERAAQARVEQMKSGYRPRVNAFGSLEYDRGWVNDSDGKSYTAGVAVQWDLWDGKMTRGRVSEAQANLEIIREENQRLRLALNLEVEQARRQLDDANERLAVTERTVGQADESVDLTRARFEQGLALSTQLIDAQTASTAAKMRRAEAQADRRIAIAALRKALGFPQLDSSP